MENFKFYDVGDDTVLARNEQEAKETAEKQIQRDYEWDGYDSPKEITNPSERFYYRDMEPDDIYEMSEAESEKNKITFDALLEELKSSDKLEPQYICTDISVM